jgi:glycosyltransferase involved in cell wall biosynthesis
LKVLHVTNIVSPHQIPFARNIAGLVGVENFRFVATEPPIEERFKLGWSSNDFESWILRAGEFDHDRKEYEQWWDEADVVICGERLFRRMNDRLRNGKLTFYMSERWWKPPIGMARMLHPRFALMANDFRNIAKSPLLHYLPMGLFAADDMKRIAGFSNRMWKWGYFTDLPNPLPVRQRDGGNFRILWAGRMIGLKRVDTLIRAFSKLQNEFNNATLTLVGDGPERKSLEKMASKVLNQGSYIFSPSVPAQQVLELMKQHHIYVLPSNGSEGWGAVVNEAMSVGCTVIASNAGGAAATMIEHGVNGLLFKSGDCKRLADYIRLLYNDEGMRHHLAVQSQRTISELWSPDIGAERFLSVSDALLAKRAVSLFDSGPMARL